MALLFDLHGGFENPGKCLKIGRFHMKFWNCRPSRKLQRLGNTGPAPPRGGLQSPWAEPSCMRRRLSALHTRLPAPRARLLHWTPGPCVRAAPGRWADVLGTSLLELRTGPESQLTDCPDLQPSLARAIWSISKGPLQSP